VSLFHDLFTGPRVKGPHPITWTPEFHKFFQACKASLSRAILLARRSIRVTGASKSAMGVVLQKRMKNAWQPLVFFSKKLNPAQQKYSAYDRQLLAIHEAVKHFRHMLEARYFIIFTDHKTITYTIQQKREKCSARQFNHLDFLARIYD
jgi:cleavage and polyadenylation specificity factor subunit 1